MVSILLYLPRGSPNIMTMYHLESYNSIVIIVKYCLYSPDDALVVRNIYILKVVLCIIVKRILSISREKFYLKCFTFHHHPCQSNIFDSLSKIRSNYAYKLISNFVSFAKTANVFTLDLDSFRRLELGKVTDKNSKSGSLFSFNYSQKGN